MAQRVTSVHEATDAPQTIKERQTSSMARAGTKASVRGAARRSSRPTATSETTLLKAAEAGWGVTLRLGMLRIIDRWPSVVLGGTIGAAGAVPAAAFTAYAKANG